MNALAVTDCGIGKSLESDFVIPEDQSQTPAVFPDRFKNASVALNKISDESGAQTVFYDTVSYATFFKEDPRKLTFNGELPEPEAKLICELASVHTFAKK